MSAFVSHLVQMSRMRSRSSTLSPEKVGVNALTSEEVSLRDLTRDGDFKNVPHDTRKRRKTRQPVVMLTGEHLQRCAPVLCVFDRDDEWAVRKRCFALRRSTTREAPLVCLRSDAHFANCSLPESLDALRGIVVHCNDLCEAVLRRFGTGRGVPFVGFQADDYGVGIRNQTSHQVRNPRFADCVYDDRTLINVAFEIVRGTFKTFSLTFQGSQRNNSTLFEADHIPLYERAAIDMAFGTVEYSFVVSRDGRGDRLLVTGESESNLYGDHRINVAFDARAATILSRVLPLLQHGIQGVFCAGWPDEPPPGRVHAEPPWYAGVLSLKDRHSIIAHTQ